jgi:hypothetical protein
MIRGRQLVWIPSCPSVRRTLPSTSLRAGQALSVAFEFDYATHQRLLGTKHFKSKIKVKILIKIKSEINIKANQNNINRNSSGQECPTHT